jgi:hypothetical protein
MKKEEADDFLGTIDIQPLFSNAKEKPAVANIKFGTSPADIRAIIKKEVREGLERQVVMQSLPGSQFNPKNAEVTNTVLGEEEWSVYSRLIRPLPPLPQSRLRGKFLLRFGKKTRTGEGIR